MNDFEAGAAMARRTLGRDGAAPTKAERKAEQQAERAKVQAGIEAEVDGALDAIRARHDREDGQRMAERNLASRRASQKMGLPMQRRPGTIR